MLGLREGFMAIVWILEWDGITPEQYEDLRGRTAWDSNLPDGLEYQVVAFSNKAMIMTQVWRSPDHVMRFMEDHLLPAVNAMGIRSMPRVDQYPVHSILQPK
jgi:hypothetical protein